MVEVTVWQRFIQDENEREAVTSDALNKNPNALTLGIEHPMTRRFQVALGARYFAFDLKTQEEEVPVTGFVGIRYQLLSR